MTASRILGLAGNDHLAPDLLCTRAALLRWYRQKTALNGDNNGSRTGIDIELGVDRGEVRFNRAPGNPHACCNLFVTFSARQASEYFLFSLGEADVPILSTCS